MAGLDAQTPIPTDVKLHQASRVLELVFANGRHFRLPYEYLRVYSPSAEVRGHGPGQETLQTGKRDVTIAYVEPVGHYALRPTFSDGHSTRASTRGITCTTSASARTSCGSAISSASRPRARVAIRPLERLSAAR